jgi:hypothetical protein
LWTAAIAVIWAAVAVFVGVGMMTTYLAAYSANLPVLLLQAQTSPWVTVGAAAAALLLVAAPIRFLGMPRAAWTGILIGQVVVLVVVSIGFLVGGPSAAAFTGLLGSDVPMGLLVVAAAFAGSRVSTSRRFA